MVQPRPHPDVAKLKKETDDDLKVVNTLFKSYSNVLKHEKGSRAAMDKLSVDLAKVYPQEKAPGLQLALKDTSEGFKAIGGVQDLYIKKVQEKVLPTIENYTTKIKSLKTSVKEFENATKKSAKQAAKVQKLPPGPQKQQADQEQKQLENQISSKINDISNEVKAYEKNRVTDFKYAMLHTTNAQMYYHAKALEQLSVLATKVNELEDLREAEVLISQLLQTKPPVHSGSQSRKQLEEIKMVESQALAAASQLKQDPTKSQLKQDPTQSQMKQDQSQVRQGESHNKQAESQNKQAESQIQSSKKP